MSNASDRPLVVVTAPVREEGGVQRLRLNIAYTSAVERSGGVPIVVPPFGDAREAARLIERVDALLLTGGEDVDPSRYGEPRHATVSTVSGPRDATEIALVLEARARGIPTLAICRGIQLLNVALGGSLVQDIPAEWPGALDHDPGGDRGARTHEVRIEPGSRLAATLGTPALHVNSFHHQAPRRVAGALRATAWAPDGIVEGVEPVADEWWALGVQWHPEELDGADTRLFRDLVERARERRAQPALS